MLFDTKTITLKDGRTAILRAPELSDAAEMISYLRDTAGETNFLIRTPDEVTMTMTEEESHLTRIRQSPGDLIIVCEVDGVIAGNCALNRLKRIKSCHRAEVSIALRKAYWGLGIGSRMFEEMIAIARAWGVMQLELEFIEGNTRGRALYEKYGFRIVGLRPNAIRLPDGTLLHEYIMVKEM